MQDEIESRNPCTILKAYVHNALAAHNADTIRRTECLSSFCRYPLRSGHIWGLERFTTLQKEKIWLDVSALYSMIGLFVSTASIGVIMRTDTTGFETRHVVPYYT